MDCERLYVKEQMSWIGSESRSGTNRAGMFDSSVLSCVGCFRMESLPLILFSFRCLDRTVNGWFLFLGLVKGNTL